MKRQKSKAPQYDGPEDLRPSGKVDPALWVRGRSASSKDSEEAPPRKADGDEEQ